MGHRHRHAQMLHLRIGENLIHGVNRAARHAGLVQPFHPFGGGLFDQARLQQRIGLVAIGVARLVGGEGRVLGFFGNAKCGHNPIPHLLPAAGQVHQPILGAEQAGRRRGRVVIAGLARDITLHGPARCLEIHHGNHGFQQAGMHPAALAGCLALQQRHQNADRRIKPRRQVSDGNARAHRALAGQAGHAHDATHALGNLVKARPLGIGAILAKARNRAQHNARVHRR